MEKHYNLYYIIQEDKAARPMPQEKHDEILKKILEFCKKIKPP